MLHYFSEFHYSQRYHCIDVSRYLFGIPDQKRIQKLYFMLNKSVKIVILVLKLHAIGKVSR